MKEKHIEPITDESILSSVFGGGGSATATLTTTCGPETCDTEWDDEKEGDSGSINP